ncbi:MAG: hypothetical protein ACI4TU_10910 [Candidatus Cryptobacteroides sp.]
MMKSKFLLVLLFLSSFATVSRSQDILPPTQGEISFGDTRVSMGNDEIIIDYEVNFGEQVQSCKIGVIMLVDGRPFKGKTYFSGDVGIILEPGTKQIRYDISKQKEQLAGKDIRFRINVLNKTILADSVSEKIYPQKVVPEKVTPPKAVPEKHTLKTVLTVTISPLSPRSFGIMVGVVKKAGGYARFQSNFSFTKEAFVADKSGAIDGGGYLWTTGEGKFQTLKFTAGALFKAHKVIYPYAGAGYGYKNCIYEDVSGDWGLIEGLCTSGLALETGLVVKAGPIALSAGISSIKFKTVSLDLGIGVIF